MTSVLVTGAQGFLGRILVPYLATCDYQVLRHGRSGELDVCADLSDASQVRTALDRAAPDIIVNLVALTDVDACERGPQQAYRSNVRTVENLVSWIQGRGATCHLVHISTDQVYDGVGPHVEEDVTLSNYYGFSKYAGELVAATVPSTILRTNFVGPSHHPERIGLSDWIVNALNNESQITVFDNVHFSPLTLQHVVECIALVIARPQRGIFNLGSRHGMSKADFAFTLARVLDLPVRHMHRGHSKDASLAAYRPTDMRMDSSKFERVYNVNLPTLEEEITSMKEAYAVRI